MNALYLGAEFILLFALSRALTKKLFQFFFLLFRGKSIAIMLVSLLHFPGTVVHELAHLFTAAVLGVPVGKLNLIPEPIRGERIEMGSVMIGKTDPFRRYAIGLAPVFAGILILSALSAFFPQLINKSIHTDNLPFWQNLSVYLLILVSYLVYAISNSMFSSKEDLEGFVPFALALVVIIGALYFIGIRIGFPDALIGFANTILATLVQALGIVLIINAILFLVAVIIMRLFFPRYR